MWILCEKFDSVVHAASEYPRLRRVKFTVEDSDVIPESRTVPTEYFHWYNQRILCQVTTNINNVVKYIPICTFFVTIYSKCICTVQSKSKTSN